MQRRVLTTKQGELRERDQVIIESDPCAGPNAGNAGYMALWNFIDALRTAPHLVRHSTDCPEVVRLSHNGSAWVLESVSFRDVQVNDPPPSSPAPSAS